MGNTTEVGRPHRDQPRAVENAQDGRLETRREKVSEEDSGGEHKDFVGAEAG